MPQLAKLRTADVPQYIIHRGINGRACFLADEDFRFYLQQLGGVARRHGCAVHAYALLSDQVHLLVTTARATGPSLLIRNLAFRYTQYFNGNYQRNGVLWEKRSRVCLVQPERYLLSCQRYIETLPVRAGCALRPLDYRWSSYGCNTYGQPSSIVLSHPVYDALGQTNEERHRAYASFLRCPISESEITTIEDAMENGRPLADDQFTVRIDGMYSRSTQSTAVVHELLANAQGGGAEVA